MLCCVCVPLQIPFDSTVRISMDTNLCMIKENPDEGPSCTLAGRWYRSVSLHCTGKGQGCQGGPLLGLPCMRKGVWAGVKASCKQESLSIVSTVTQMAWCTQMLLTLHLVCAVVLFRDPTLPINRSEITRFPHAVLEVKLSLGQGQTSPAWVQVRGRLGTCDMLCGIQSAV